MIRFLDTSIGLVCRLCGGVAALMTVALAMLVVTSIVSRLLGIYVAGLTDYAAYCLAGAGAFGMAYTFGEAGHIRVGLFIERLEGRARYAMELLVLSLSTAMAGYLAWYLVRMVAVSMDFQDRSDGSDEILIWIPQAPFAAGFCLFALILFLTLLRTVLAGNLDGLATSADPDGWE